MAAAQEKNGKTEELTLPEKLNEFIQKNRRLLLICLIAILVILAGLITGITIREKIQSKAFSQVEGFNIRYEALRIFIDKDDEEGLAKQADIDALLDELRVFEGKKSGFAAARAYCISASIYADQKKWAESERAWFMASKEAGKSYLAPVSLYNAAVAAEEQGNIDVAIGLYNQALAFGNVFPSAARAQFSIGRLEESRNNREAALEAYRNLVSKWPGDQVWGNLAQSRIVVLSE